jgi:menaquinol-cytochrome c reductase iron-sulfur subunit
VFPPWRPFAFLYFSLRSLGACQFRVAFGSFVAAYFRNYSMQIQNDRQPCPERRSFLKKIATVIFGGIAALIPASAGLAVFLDPLRRRAEQADFVRVTSIEALPADGIPRRFTIVSSHADAWNKYPEMAVGAVYLRRTEDGKLQALHVVCPHAGCFIDYLPVKQTFFCPCHNSAFGLDGSIADPRSPSPRPMDELVVEVRQQSEVWVKFQNFRTGQAQKIRA